MCREQQVRDFLFGLYGADPQPLRTYLTRQEVFDLMSRCAGAKAVTSDLNLTGYGGKWRNAVEDQIRDGLDPATWDFWHRARTAFLEYGGEYQAGQEPPSKTHA